ncbi:hypothetical protein AJ87_15965 [Rhizobium yanglingense]|nr:hypothetical protein AJ87_15965 [Rhizobium yanglingense]
MNQRNLTLHSTVPKASDDSDSFIDIDRLIAILFRRAGSIALCVVAFVALAAIYLILSTPVYTSMTQILLDDSMTKYAEDEAPAASAQQVDMQIASAVEILKSNELALSVVDAQNLSENDTILDPGQGAVELVKSGVKLIASALTPGGPPASEENARNGRRQKAAAMLQQALSVERVSRSSVIAVAFRSTDKMLAARVTKAYADAYLNDQLNANFDATERASVWLQERLADLRDRSQQAALEVQSSRPKTA